MTGSLQAVLYAPDSTAGRTVQVSLAGDDLRIADAGEPERVHRRDRLAIPEYMPGVPLTVRLPDGSSLEIADDRFARQLAARSGRLLAFFERHLVLLAALLLAASLVPYAFHRLALPAMTPMIAERLTVEDIRQLEDRIFAQLVQAEFFEILEGDEYVHQRALIADQGARLAAAVADSEFSYQFILVSGRRFGANAFALPGGRVLVTDRLADLLTEGQLAGVLAHEIAHIELRHSMNALIRSSVFGAFMLLMLGDIWSIVLPSAISDLAYSRADELAADCQAASYLAAAGMDPQLIGSALEELFGDSRIAEPLRYLSTHPDRQQRRENLLACEAVAAGESG